MRGAGLVAVFSNVFPCISCILAPTPHSAPSLGRLLDMRTSNLPMTFGSSENRAATMSTVSGPPPPGPLSERSTSPDRKSRTLQGPSPKEWARHRETIIDLYRQFPLKRVSEIMRKHHGFSAR